MKKEDLFKQYEELKANEEDIDCLILYIHMPTGEEEVIVNPNVVDKMQYIDKTYNDDLIHANCNDIYITDAIFSVNDDSCMDFGEALALMKEGYKVKLPSWGGYWSWDQEKETIIMHTKDGEDLDIRETQRVSYTLENVLSEEWQIADEQNCPELGGEATFGFGDAYKFLERGFCVTKKSWHNSGMFLTMQFPDEHSKMTAPYVYITIDGEYRVPWHPSQADMSEKDWILYSEE